MALSMRRVVGCSRAHPRFIMCTLYGAALVLSTLCLAGSMVHITHGLTEQDVVHVAGAVLMAAASLSSLLAMVVLTINCRRIASGAEAFAERVLLVVLGVFYLTAGAFALAHHQDYCLGRATRAAKLLSCAERRMGLIAGILAWGTIIALLGYNVYRTRWKSLPLQPSFETAAAAKAHPAPESAPYWADAEAQGTRHQASLGWSRAHEPPPTPHGRLHKALDQLRSSFYHG
ncbi:hypothetical protein H4R35_001776 [Dimargaris xerosporica]|nr:hypothetical protein H4R35_001776 [Dimargaris xerosporica]